MTDNAKPAIPIVERAFTFETRAADGGDGLTLSGYAAVFNTPTRIDSWEGLFDEQIAPGAFKRSIKERMPVLQWNHGSDPAIGQVPIGAITTLREDDHGLFVEARLHDNVQVQPVRDAIASGAVSGMSFRFQVLDEQITKTDDVPLRTVRQVRLHELGPVVFPAYPTTTVGVRSEPSPDDGRAVELAPAIIVAAPVDTTRAAQQQFLRDLIALEIERIPR